MHVDNVKDVLQKPNANVVLMDLLSGKKKMTELQEKVKNYASLKLLILELEKAGYVKVEESSEGKKVIYVSLTEKGRAVAEQLRRADWISKLSPEELEKFKNLRALIHVNIYEDHITIMDIHMGESRIANIYARPKGDEIYFYCDLHQDVNCYHIQYMFADPDLSDFIRNWIEKNGFKLPAIYKKYVDEYW